MSIQTQTELLAPQRTMSSHNVYAGQGAIACAPISMVSDRHPVMPTPAMPQSQPSGEWRPLTSYQRAQVGAAIRRLDQPVTKDYELFMLRYKRDQPEHQPGACTSFRRIREDGSWRDASYDQPAITVVRVICQTAFFKQGVRLGNVLAYRKYGVETCRQPLTRFEAWDVEMGDMPELRQPGGPGVFATRSAYRPERTASEPRPPAHSSTGVTRGQPHAATYPPVRYTGQHAQTSTPSAVGNASISELIAIAKKERASAGETGKLQQQRTTARDVKALPANRILGLRDAQARFSPQMTPTLRDRNTSPRRSVPPALHLRRSNHSLSGGKDPLSPSMSVSPCTSTPGGYSLANGAFTPGRRYPKRKASAIDISKVLEDERLFLHMRKRRVQHLTSSIRDVKSRSPLKSAFRVGPRPPASPRLARSPKKVVASPSKVSQETLDADATAVEGVKVPGPARENSVKGEDA